MDFKNDKHIIFTTIFITLSLFIVFTFFFMSEIKDVNASNNSVAKTEIKKVSFVGVGDNLIHDSIYNCADLKDGVYGDGKYDFDSLYSNIKNDIKNYDLRYINQESIIAGDQYGASTYPQFNTPESMIKSLTDSGFNVFNMANNHSLDMGSNGIESSIDIWNKIDNVYFTGLFKSQEDRDNPLIIEKNGLKIALLSYTYGTNGILPDKEYKVSYLDEDAVRKDIAKVSPKSDFILVSAHWGEEGIEEIDATQEKFARLFNELGVDAVIGTHAHRIQKAEWLKNSKGKDTLVYYGTGNFVHNMLGAHTYLEGMPSWTFVKDGDKKYIENAKFTPLVFHLERNQYGLDGSVYRLDKYPLELANKHIEMRGAGSYHIENYKTSVKRLIPEDMIDMDL